MPTLIFSDRFTKFERKILQHTFHSNVRTLEIENTMASIFIDIQPIGQPGNLGMIVPLSKDQFIVYLNSMNNMDESVYALGHEMVHYRQHVRGQLSYNDDKSIMFWEGKPVPAAIANSRMFYHVLPWEVEAHKLDQWLYDVATEIVTSESDKTNKPAYALLT